jgi:putative DNA methylase
MSSLSKLEPLPKLNLALLISTSLDFNSLLCGYKGGATARPGAVRHTFSHHAYSFPYTALENNPLYPGKASGTLQKLFHDRIRRARLWAYEPRERRLQDGRISLVTIPGEVDAGTEVTQREDILEGSRRFRLLPGSSTSLDLESGSVDAVVTDPPYYDSVQYSDLARFFHVWLKRMLPEDTVWEVDLGDAAVDSGTRNSGQYRRILGGIMAECRRVLKNDNGRLIFSFHHWNPQSWIELTLAMKEANFRLLNHYAVHSENTSSVHIANQRALIHDSILVFAPAHTSAQRVWHKPAAVDSSSSQDFCQDCASVLGWLLDNSYSEAEIARLWFEFLDPV